MEFCILFSRFNLMTYRAAIEFIKSPSMRESVKKSQHTPIPLTPIRETTSRLPPQPPVLETNKTTAQPNRNAQLNKPAAQPPILEVPKPAANKNPDIIYTPGNDRRGRANRIIVK